MTKKMKINRKILTGLGLSLFLLLGGCDLDRYPYNSVTPDDGFDEGSFETLTLGNYAKMKEEYFYKTIHQYGEYGGDNVALSGSTNDLLTYCYTYSRSVTNHYPANLWEFTYNILVNINKLIPQIEAAQADEPSDVARHLLGENYFLRSFLYFHCCNVFALPYLHENGAENNLGLPIKIKDDPDDFPPRSSVKQVYDQIVADAKKAARLMERTGDMEPKSSVYASQEVAWAFLSRVYLYMGEYETAAKYCDSVFTANRDTRTYSLVQGDTFRNYPQIVPELNNETIFAIRMTKDVDYEKYHMEEYSVGAMYAKIYDQGWGEMYPSETYLELLRRNPSDLRFGWIQNQVAGTGQKWMIYTVGDEATKKYDYKTHTVEQQADGSYRITEDQYTFTSTTVQEEISPEGNIQYYVTTLAGVRHNVWIEEVVKPRDETTFPMRFIMKCSLQEGQAQLYSPVMIRLAEIYLNRAECRYHAGDYQGAIDDINEIRIRAGIPPRSLSGTADPATDVLEWVLDERRLELAWEGHRRYDVFRNGKTLNRRYPGQHLAGAADNVLLDVLPNDPRIAEYIPRKEIDSYPGGALVQNP